MAQDLELIVEMLREMKRANGTNSEGFDRLLYNIEHKLDSLDKNVATSEFIKTYLSELAKLVEEKYSTTLSMFSDIENAVKNIYQEQDKHSKNSELKESFETFSNNMNDFYLESRHQKSLLTSIESKLTEITNNKSDKEDVRRLVNSLKNDFENINHSYKDTIDNLNTDLKNILTNILKLDQSTATTQIYEQVEIVSRATNHIIKYLENMDNRDANLEKILSSVATNENLKFTQGIIDSIIEKTEEISSKIDALAQKTDIGNLIDEKLEDVATKDLIEKISKTTDSLVAQTDAVKQSLAEVTKNLESHTETKALEDSLQKLFIEFNDLSEDINKITTNEKISDVDSKIATLTEEFLVIKNIVEDLNEVVTSKILSVVENISFETQSYDIKTHVSKMLSVLPQKEDIDRVLENNEQHKTLLQNLVNKAEKIDKNVLWKTDEIENMIDKLNFDEEFAHIYNKAASIEDWLVESKIKENSEEILSKFPVKPDQKDIEEILTTSKQIASDLAELSKISDNNGKKDFDVHEQLEEIKNLLSSKQVDVEGANTNFQSSVDECVDELKSLLQESGVDCIQRKLVEIEELLRNRASLNEKAISDVVKSVDNLANSNYEQKDFAGSLAEIEEIQNQLKELGTSFENLSQNNDINQRNISTFVADKFSELSSDLGNIVKDFENKVNTGFVYNVELIEEKTAVLLDLIKELRHTNSDNIDLYERLTVSDNLLIDIKQELDLVGTDIVNNFNSKTESLIGEITPIKETLATLSGMPTTDDIKEQLAGLYDSIKEELAQSQTYSQVTCDKLDDVYTKISNEIVLNENNLRDFVLSDIDSVIIKLDSIKTDWEEMLDKISFPEVEDMVELKDFCAQIKEFKDQQKEILADFAQDIKKSINEQLAHDREDIKSLIALSDNSEEILNAIENLKSNFIQKLEQIDFSKASNDEFAVNEYEKEFAQSEVSQVVDGLNSDFEKFSELVSKLSDKNPELEEVLDRIKNKISEIDKVKTPQDSEFNIVEDEEQFDIIKAFELLKQDINSLQSALNESKPVDKSWLNEVKKYVCGDDVKSMLDVLDKKIDVIASTDNSEDFLNIKETLESIENKLDLTTFPEVSDSDFPKKLSESDAKITSMLELLNHKIDILADDDNTDTIYALDDVRDLILAQQDSISKLEKNDKTEAFRKCLDELTTEVNNISTDNSQQIQKTLKDMKESIMSAVVTIFEQVSFIEESEDIKDFVEEKTDEINKNLVEVTEQLKQISNSNAENDYNYSMQDIESDLAKLRLALNELKVNEDDEQAEKLSSILDNISMLGSTVENLQSSMFQEEEFSDMKTKLNQLVISSDESYNTLGKILTEQLSKKVDNVTKLLEKSNASDKVMRQALIYMGEWIDSASESMDKISNNSEEIVDIKSSIEALKTSVPEHTNILNSIEEKFDEQQERLAFFEKQITKLGSLEDSFEQQQDRINRLEMSLDKILSVVEDIDDSKISRKIDKIEKQIAKLSTNIEKLTSYVD